jgi:SOS-response transcriptional repressor LexA
LKNYSDDALWRGSDYKFMKTEIFPLYPRTKNTVMIARASVSCGEASEICTELERADLNEIVTGGRDGVYLIRARGDSMEHEIRRGDWLIVDRNQPAKFGDAILAFVNGDYLVKDFEPKRNGLMLVPKNKKYPSLSVTAKDDFEVFGVITGIYRNFKKN